MVSGIQPFSFAPKTFAQQQRAKKKVKKEIDKRRKI